MERALDALGAIPAALPSTQRCAPVGALVPNAYYITIRVPEKAQFFPEPRRAN
jgi:hypothetical protein